MRWSRRQDPRVRDELRYHRDRLVDDYVAAGMDRQAAERRAFLEFGNIDGLEEAVRDVRGRWWADFLQDLRYACRTLRRSPGFALAAVLSLALGIGANAGIFSVINAVMLRSLPVNEPDRLVLISRLNEEGRPLWLPFPLVERLHDSLRSVSGLATLATSRETAVIDGDDELVEADLVSGIYFDVLAVRPAAGRLLAPSDDVIAPVAPAVVISHHYWTRRFARDPMAVGKVITVRNRLFTIVGVTPASFQSIRPDRTPDVMLPLLAMLSEDQRQAIDMNNYMVIARLRPGATVAQTNAEVQAVYRGFLQFQASQERERDRPAILRQRAAATAAPDGFNAFRYEYGRSLVVLMGSVGLVLLLACVNLSGLLLARAAARQREIAIRLAIGAGRGRLIRQFLTESFVLALIGAGVGLLIAGWLSVGLFGLFVNGRDVAISVAPDWRVMAFTSAVAAAACLLSGLTPALHAVRAGVQPALKQTRGGGSSRLGKSLVVAQLAISMILLVGATLFIGTFVKLHAVDRGFDSRGVLIASVRAAQPYPAARIAAVKQALVDRLGRLPGVRSATAAQVVPVGGGLWDRTIQVEGYRFRGDESDAAGFNAVAPGYFATIGTPLRAGREFGAHDTGTAPRVAIVNDSFARYFFRDAAGALGRHVTAANVTYEIVGVVGDAKYRTLRDPVIRTMYIPWMQRDGDPQPSSFAYIVRAASGDPRRLIPELGAAVREADPALRVTVARSYDELIGQSIGTERIMATLGAMFAVLALMVAGLGLFGLMAFQVARRTNEIGLRMALGANRVTMMTLVLRDAAVMVVIGVALGIGAAMVVTGAARKLLFGLSPTEPAAFAVAAVTLASAALMAAWLPARRAANIDPLVALRHE